MADHDPTWRLSLHGSKIYNSSNSRNGSESLPQTLLAAYRVADSPMNTITPLMVYLSIILTFAQRYQKDAGIGTIVALMMPYAIIVLVVWTILFIEWFVLDIPLGLGYLPEV